VDPSPPFSPIELKARLRKRFRAARREHVAGLPQGLRALILNRPPAPVAQMVPAGATVGLYFPIGSEAPTLGWARWLAENDRKIALPYFPSRESPMEFREWGNPFDEEVLELSPWGGWQPTDESAPVSLDAVVVPLIAFTAKGERLGQGGGHYDRWLEANPQVRAIGLAWDCQIADALPTEAHDRMLEAIVTPTRIYEGSL
jgi:5-formyltetrahydrofolate cyclo-ligase